MSTDEQSTTDVAARGNESRWSDAREQDSSKGRDRVSSSTPFFATTGTTADRVGRQPAVRTIRTSGCIQADSCGFRRNFSPVDCLTKREKTLGSSMSHSEISPA